MPLVGTDALMAKKIYEQIKNQSDPEEAWKAFAKVIITHLVENSQVTGTTPNGGPLVDGKLV